MNRCWAKPLLHIQPLPKMRLALNHLQQLFPFESEKVPAGLTQLFQMLSQMSLDQAGPWGDQLRQNQRDLLCDYFTHAPNPKVVLAISLILDRQRDDRFAQVLRFFFLMNPKPNLIEELRRRWSGMTFYQKLAGPGRWINTYLASTPSPDLLAWLSDCLAKEELTIKELISGFSQQTPLFHLLTDFFFEKGGALLASLQPEWAAEQVVHYFKRDQTLLVLNYLRYYPTRFWKPEFLQALYQAKGNPDPRQGGFWEDLDRGTLWRVRRALFEPMMEALSDARLELWQRWLHRCVDWKLRQHIAHIYIHPFHIVEEPDASLVYPQENALNPIEIINYDSKWSLHMEKLLSEYVKWG